MDFVPSWEYMGENIGDYVNSSAFYETRTTNEICMVLDFAKFLPEQFDKFLINLSHHHDRQTILDIIKHATVDFSNKINKISDNLQTISKVLDVPLFKTISDILKANIKEVSIDNQIKNLKEYLTSPLNAIESNVCTKLDNIWDQIHNCHFDERFQNLNTKIDTRCDEIDLILKHQCKNYNTLKMISRKSENFDQIYSIFAQIARENDIASAKLAMNDGYMHVKAEKPDDNKEMHIFNIIEWAAYRCNFDLVKILIKCGVTKDLNNTLWISCMNGNLEIVKMLMKYTKVEPNSLSFGNTTPLYAACLQNHESIVTYLVTETGVDVNLGVSPLSAAKSENIIRLLKEHGAR